MVVYFHLWRQILFFIITMKLGLSLAIIWGLFIIGLITLRLTMSTPSYNSMTAWELLDIKLDYDTEIQTLKDQRQIVIDKYNIKRWRVNTGTTKTGAIEEFNEAMGLPKSTK